MEYDETDDKYMVEEEDAIWVLKMLLPYVNELLVKLRRLFSGDPATTLKVGFGSSSLNLSTPKIACLKIYLCHSGSWQGCYL